MQFMNKTLLLLIVSFLSLSSKAALVLPIDSVIRMGLPVVVVETVNHEEPTSEVVYPPEGGMGIGIKNATKVPGRVVVISAAGDTIFDSGEYVKKKSGMTIKHRGNTSSSVFDKKAFKIKLQAKGDMLGRGEEYADKNWALLKNDNCNLVTMVSLKVCELMGQDWVPAMKYVNLVFNGEYRGFYMLSETVERNTECRINVKKTGYLIESDPYWWNENLCFDGVLNIGSYKYTFKYPDPEYITAQQLSYIKRAVAEMENSINDGTYEKFINVNSFANWLMIQDILGQSDAGGSNRFLTKKDSTDKSLFEMGTPWDFDCTFLNKKKTSFANIHNEFYFKYLFDSSNRAFAKAYVDRWKEVRESVIDKMLSFLENYRSSSEGKAIDKSWIADEEVWHLGWKMIYGKTFDANIDTLENWFTLRRQTLDRLIQDIDTTTLTGIEIPKMDQPFKSDDKTYNLMGQQVAPMTKGIVIRRGRKYINR